MSIDPKSKLIMKSVLSYLNDNFTPWNLNKFSITHSNEIYKRLSSLISKRDIIKHSNVIKQSIEKFFHNLGSIDINIALFNKINIKTDIKESTFKTFDFLQKYKSNFEINEKSNLLVINEQITKNIFSQAKTSQELFRQNIRCTLPLVIDVGQRYAILFGKSRITVRSKLDDTSNKKRFAGLPEEELKSLCEVYFKDIHTEITQLLKPILPRLFCFENMSNSEFENKHIETLQLEILKLVLLRSNQDKETNKVLANYILRVEFISLHNLLAIQLINDVTQKKEKAIEFLSFFTKGVINISKQKYQIPKLDDDEGNLWSLVNINNINIQYDNLITTLEKKSSLINKLNVLLDIMSVDIKKAEKALYDDKSKFEDKLHECNQIKKRIKDKEDALKALDSMFNSSKKDELEKSKKELEKEIIIQMRQHNKLEKIALDARISCNELKYKRKMIEKKVLLETTNLQSFQISHKITIKKYALMLSAVTKALITKRKKI